MNNSKLRSVSNRTKSNSVHDKALLSKNQPLEIVPQEVVFKEIQVNQYYEITVEIRNLTTKASRIRIMDPTNANFKIVYSKQPEIAPGLSMTAKVKYECKELKNQMETIKIMSEEGYTMELPVRVYKTQSQILFEPFVNMGFLKLGKEHVETIAIRNSGKANSIVEFSHTHGTLLSIEPKILKIPPMHQEKLIVKYKPTEAGLFKGVINLKSDSILVKSTIDIHATAVEFARFVVDDKGSQTSSFDFGTVFVGQESFIRAFIVNNSPKKMKFKTFFRKGYLSNIEEFALVQTPTEIGNEQCQRTMFIEPENGEVEAFGQFEFKIYCKSRISYKDKIYTNNYALTPSEQEGAINSMKNSPDFKPENIHQYSVLVNVEEDDPMIVQLKANAVCPTIKVSDNLFKFGDCNNKETREIEFTVENKSNFVKTEVTFPKIPNFSFQPSIFVLKPLEKYKFKAIFEPKTIGKIDTTQLLLINKLYEIELRCFGISTSGSASKSRMKEHPISSKQIPSPNKKMEPVKNRGKAFSLTDKAFISEMRKTTYEQEKAKVELASLTINKDKYNQYLIDRRTERADSQKQQQVQKKWSLYQTKLKDMGNNSKLEEKYDEEGLPSNPPIDYEFQTGMIDTKLVKQNIPIPQSKEKLFVTRHIMDYEPLPNTSKQASGGIEKFYRDFREAPKKIYPETPQNYNHKREVAQELTPEELAQVEVSSNVIQFGEVYIKSLSKGYFWVKNSSKKAVSVQLGYKDQELTNSNKKAQIIPSSAEAAFEIAFCKDTLGDFRSTIKYYINSVHEFEMTITAKCVPVTIDVDRINLKFGYDEPSVEMSTKEIIKLTNPGNSDAVFKFTLGKQKYYNPSIIEGKIGSKETISIPILFCPPEIKQSKSEYNFTERLVLKVLDGPQVTILCTCSLHDPKFTVKPLTTINPILCVGHKFEDVVQIKNTSKLPIVVHITGKVLEINERVKISPDEVKKFKVKFSAKDVGIFNGEIIIQPRCGIMKTIQTQINVIEPKITFSKEQIDFGVLVVQGIVGKTTFTLINESEIQMPLVFDLRPPQVKQSNPQGIEAMSIKLVNSDEQLDVMSPTIKEEVVPINVQTGQNLAEMEINEDDLNNSEDSEEEIVEKNQEEYRRFKLHMKSKKLYEFEIQFYPKEVSKYQFELPLSIEGSKAKIKNSPVIICEGIKPQFLFEPSIVDFKRKIVTKPERSYPKYINITISNLDDTDCLWQLHDDDLKKDGIFTIQKSKGELKGKKTIEIRASFNPYAVGEYEVKMPLFIKNRSLPEPLKYVDVIFKGTSSLPNMYFNKREVIMPVVPLDIETTSSFRILNDGYENCNLKCQFLDDVADLGVKVSFPEGNNIGITRQKLKVDLSWKYSKPISFCLKLQFTDDLNRTFVIPVSGTTDNCIFTNYTFFLRNENKFVIKPQGALKIVESTESTTGLARKNSSHSMRSNVTGKSVMSYLGVMPISPVILSNTIDYINRYLNANLLTTPIKQFPSSVIDADGQQIFQILAFVSNKNVNFPWKYSPNPSDKQVNKVTRLFTQYNQLIKMLKIEGAQLNHIRPEYLLSFSDLNVYLQNLPAQKSKFFMPSLLKINTGLFNYLSLESWITLLYQIFKIYILARVTVKNFKSHLPSLPEIPKLYLEPSNFVSVHESLIFYWVEQAILEILLEERRFTNFDKDFKDGIAIGSLLQKYSGVNVLKKMKMICTTEEDFKQNAQIICEGLGQIGMLNHITPKDIYNPLQRQMLLFILHLYVYLPFYIPKQEPVVFKCILGEEVVRAIELTNPSSKAVTYQVRYEGSDDFKIIGDEKFRIEPKEIYKFQVKFVSRISSPVKGKIMFINVKENSLTAAALVFELQSQIVGRTSDRIWNISGILYEQVQFSIEVFNKFTTAQIVDFSISYQTEYIFDQKTKAKNGTHPLTKDQQIQTVYGKQENLKIRKNGTGILTLNYVPMSLYTTKTTIFFLNSVIGQFQHEVIASVEPPGSISEIRPPMQLSVDQIVNWQFQINPKNEQINRARKAIESLKKYKKNAGSKQKQLQNQVSFINQQFFIEIPPNPYISAKDNIQISEKVREDKKGSKEDIIDSQNKIPFTIICKNPVYQFSTYILLTNKSKTDVRRYKIAFTVQPKPLKAILQMNVPARGEVTQNLPIVNNTERDWIIKVQWQPDPSKNGNYFIVPSQFLSSFPVKRNSIGNFPITFKPKWAHEAEAKLTLSNALTLDNFEYQILGHGEQPLAEEHIQIKCEVKEIIKKELIVKNPYSERPVVFNIETDLLNCTAPKKLTIPSGGKQKLEFTVHPMLCGEYTGSITLFEEDGPQYIWYTISVITNYPQAYKSLTIESQIRQKLLTEIHLPYDGKEESTFQVIINGEGLSGDPTCSVKPNYKNVYILEYLPLEIGLEKASICFINSGVGQILFELDLKCTPKPPIVINNLKSPLGVSTSIFAELENPTSSKAVVKVSNTNPDVFVIKSQTIRLEPLEKKKIEIEYIPSNLDAPENGKIIFSSKNIGDWIYDLSGIGQMPVPYPIYNTFNGLLDEHSDSVKFRNPFKYEIVVGVKLIDESDKGIFKIMAHGKTRFQIDSNGILEIPFSFIPSACKMYSCKIIVMISEKIFWTFPIRGVTEVNDGKVIANMITPCRQATSEFIQVALEGAEYTSKNNLFEYSFENIPAQFQKQIEKCLVVDFLKNNLKHANDNLELEFIFKPMKPIKVAFDLLITKQEGSRWRFRIILEGTDPEVDDIIDIESNLMVTSSVVFKLTNVEKSAIAFKAKFTSDSAHQFSVQPKQGTLAPFGSKGTNFYISYTPVEYGKQKKGKLIIETADMYWSYLLKGSLPKYVPPKIEASRSRINSEKK